MISTHKQDRLLLSTELIQLFFTIHCHHRLRGHLMPRRVGTGGSKSSANPEMKSTSRNAILKESTDNPASLVAAVSLITELAVLLRGNRRNTDTSGTETTAIGCMTALREPFSRSEAPASRGFIHSTVPPGEPGFFGDLADPSLVQQEH